MSWEHTQKHELEYWGNCLGMRAWGEFVKQEMYGREMQVFAYYGLPDGELDLQGRSVLDVGGGPVSMTLRCRNAAKLVVVDPCDWPESVFRRYTNYGIEFVSAKGEDLDTALSVDEQFDEVWLYNVLQHVDNPVKVIQNAIARTKSQGRFRICEWVDVPADDCHPHVLTVDTLRNWISVCNCSPLFLHTPYLQEYWCKCTAFVGVYKPDA